MFLFNLNGKFSSGKANAFDKPQAFKNFQLALVKTVGKVQVKDADKSATNRNLRFNADTHAIRVRIVGSKYDNKIPDNELANCFPLLPKHINLVPKEGEMVMVMVFGEDEKYGDRYYIGPFISSEEKLNKDLFEGTATSNLANGTATPSREISQIKTAKGIFENPQNVVIQGRYNTDIIQRPNEILIRAGKFKTALEPTFNNENPAFIQMSHNVITIPQEDETKLPLEVESSVTNIVSNKINLLTYKDGAPEFNDLTFVNGDDVAEYITNEQLEIILKEAHPLVFGDTLVEYLKLFKDAFVQHVHNGASNEPTDRNDRGTLAVEKFLKEARSLEKDMLSKNIRIN